MEVNKTKNALEIAVESLIEETQELLSEIINATKASDERAKKHRASWTERHRLHVLLEAAEDTRAKLPHAVTAPWFLAELRATLDVVSRWRKEPFWKDIEQSLKDPTHFKHTILKLHVAEHLEKGGHKVEIVPKGENASADLMFRAIGGRQALVYVECYQPDVLCGRVAAISNVEVKNIVKRSMEKAKRQIGCKNPGLLAICGYNQSVKSVENLRQAVDARLKKSSGANLCGIMLMMLGVVFYKDTDKMAFVSTRTIKLIRNPSYFWSVDIDTKFLHNDPELIEEPLIDVTTDSLISGDTDQTEPLAPGNSSPIKVEKSSGAITRTKKLNIIEKPKPLSKAVVYGISDKVPPLFKGEGAIDSLCGQCGAILAARVWELSISNVVIACPTCETYNEFPPIHISNFPRVQLAKDNYELSRPVLLKSGRCIEGQ